MKSRVILCACDCLCKFSTFCKGNGIRNLWKNGDQDYFILATYFPDYVRYLIIDNLIVLFLSLQTAYLQLLSPMTEICSSMGISSVPEYSTNWT